jgi:hypothetical protein
MKSSHVRRVQMFEAQRCLFVGYPRREIGMLARSLLAATMLLAASAALARPPALRTMYEFTAVNGDGAPSRGDTNTAVTASTRSAI